LLRRSRANLDLVLTFESLSLKMHFPAVTLPVIVKIADKVTGGLIDRYVTHPVTDWLSKQENHRDFSSALSDALAALYNSGYAIEGTGAIDDSFLEHPDVFNELWEKLLDPSSKDEIDYDKLFSTLESIWKNEKEFSEDLKSRQREAIEFLVETLYDEFLWRKEIFKNKLNTRILKRLDDYLSKYKRRYVIKSYLLRSFQLIHEQQKKLMGRGAVYLEPIIQRLRDKSIREEQFRVREKGIYLGKVGKEERERFEPVDFNTYFLAGPDNRMAVIADSGLGKTTLLQEVFLRACQTWTSGKPVPFFMTPNQGASCSETTVQDIIFVRLKDSGIHVRDNQLRMLVSDLLEKNDVLLLFDALDQMGDPQPLLGYLESTTLWKKRVILTTRPTTWGSYQSSLGSFAYLRLLNFDRDRIVQYYGELLNAPQLKYIKGDVLGIPVLAHMIRELLSQDKNIETTIANRSQLYNRFIRMLPSREEDRKIVGQRSPEDILDDLFKLGFETLKKNLLGQFPRGEAKRIIGEESLRDLERLQYVMRFVETGDEIAFRHRSFQEYFAAEELNRIFQKSDDIYKIAKFVFHPNWEESIKFLAGILDKQRLEALLNIILNPEADQVFLLYDDHLRLACLCLRESPLEGLSPEDDLINKINDILKKHLVIAVNLLTIWGKDKAQEKLLELGIRRKHLLKILTRPLSETKPSQAVNLLIGTLLDKNEKSDVRKEAAKALGEIRSIKGLKSLIRVSLDKHEYLELRRQSIDTLGKIKREKAVDPLMLILQEDKDNGIRNSAIYSLGNIKSPKAIPLLIQVLANDKSKGIRSCASYALGVMKANEATDILVHILLNKKEFTEEHKQAMIALVNINSSEAIQLLIAALFNALNNNKARCRAVKALGELKSNRAVTALIKILFKDNDRTIRSCATNSLIKIKSNKVIRLLSQTLLNYKEPAYVRRRAAYVLSNIDNDKLVDPLILALKWDSESSVRWLAAEALGKYKNEGVVETLMETLQNKNENIRVRSNAAFALRNSVTEKHVKPLTKLLNNTCEAVEIRRQIAYVLGNIKSESLIEHFIQILHNAKEDHIVRLWIVRAIGKVRSNKLLEPFIQILLDEEQNIDLRCRVARTLGVINSDKALEPLLQILLNSSEIIELRCCAARSLKELKSDNTLAAFIQILQNEKDNELRCWAIKAMEEIKSEKALEPLIYSLKDENAEVRRRVRNAIKCLVSYKTLNILLLVYNNTEYIMVRAEILKLIKLVDRALRSEVVID
jgi:HEAT repeat protein